MNRIHFDAIKRLYEGLANGALTAVTCVDAKTKQFVQALAVIEDDGAGGKRMVPIAKLFDGDPYKELIPPPSLAPSAHEIEIEVDEN